MGATGLRATPEEGMSGKAGRSFRWFNLGRKKQIQPAQASASEGFEWWCSNPESYGFEAPDRIFTKRELSDPDRVLPELLLPFDSKTDAPHPVEEASDFESAELAVPPVPPVPPVPDEFLRARLRQTTTALEDTLDQLLRPEEAAPEGTTPGTDTATASPAAEPAGGPESPTHLSMLRAKVQQNLLQLQAAIQQLASASPESLPPTRLAPSPAPARPVPLARATTLGRREGAGPAGSAQLHPASRTSNSQHGHAMDGCPMGSPCEKTRTAEALQVIVTAAEGPLEDAILECSFRGVRRQEELIKLKAQALVLPLSHGPRLATADDTLQVSLLQLQMSATFALHPGCSVYVWHSEGRGSISFELSSARRGVSSQELARWHTQYIGTLLEATLLERPPDPFDFMAQLMNCCAQAPEDGSALEQVGTRYLRLLSTEGLAPDSLFSVRCGSCKSRQVSLAELQGRRRLKIGSGMLLQLQVLRRESLASFPRRESLNLHFPRPRGDLQLQVETRASSSKGSSTSHLEASLQREYLLDHDLDTFGQQLVLELAKAMPLASFWSFLASKLKRLKLPIEGWNCHISGTCDASTCVSGCTKSCKLLQRQQLFENRSVATQAHATRHR